MLEHTNQSGKSTGSPLGLDRPGGIRYCEDTKSKGGEKTRLRSGGLPLTDPFYGSVTDLTLIPLDTDLRIGIVVSMFTLSSVSAGSGVPGPITNGGYPFTREALIRSAISETGQDRQTVELCVSHVERSGICRIPANSLRPGSGCVDVRKVSR